jgi:flagellar hook-length control protein FliK
LENTDSVTAEKTPSPEKSADSEPFANALMGQIGLLNEANGPALPGQLQRMATPPAVNNAHNSADPLPNKDSGQELAELLDKVSAAAAKKNDTGAVSLDASLSALTAALSSITPDNVATAQNLSEVMAANGLLVAPAPAPPEEPKLQGPVENAAISGAVLNKETRLRQSVQNEQSVTLAALENTDSVTAEKTPSLKKQSSLLAIDPATSGTTAAMSSAHSPVDNKVYSSEITRPLTHPGWGKDLGGQIVWLYNKDIPAAEIKLNPEHLGPMSVRIDIEHDQATIIFTAQHAEVKEAIEASIPKLRDMLGAQQINLVNVTVSQNATSDQRQSQAFYKTPENNGPGLDAVADAPAAVEHERISVSKGLLSIYA